MADVIATQLHPFWGLISQRQGYDEWEVHEEHGWPSVGTMAVRFYLCDPEDKQVQHNFIRLHESWESVWPRILRRTELMRADYGRADAPVDMQADYFYVRIPNEAIEAGASWSVMLQSEDGWLLDFRGWEDAGGQGVF
jgi:hypothetical protein